MSEAMKAYLVRDDDGTALVVARTMLSAIATWREYAIRELEADEDFYPNSVTDLEVDHVVTDVRGVFLTRPKEE